MSLSKYSKRRGQFEALEAKQLFAADLAGGAAADLPDTVIVAQIDSSHTELVRADIIDPNDCPRLGGQEGEPVTETIDDGLANTPSLTNVSAESDDTVQSLHVAAFDPGDAVSGVHGDLTNSLKNKDFTVEQNLAPNLDGQEGEPIVEPVSDMVFENLEGQEGDAFAAEGITGDSATLVAVDRVFSMSAIRIPMTADTSGIGAVDVSRIAAVDACSMSQGAIRLI